MRDRAQLTLRDVSLSYGDRLLLDHVSFTVRPGEKAFVIGENGSGKSTLLRLVDGTESPDEGEVLVRFPGAVARLGQTLGETYGVGPRHTVRDTVDLALAELRRTEAELRVAEERLAAAGPAELAAYGDLLDRYEELGGHRADAVVAATLHDLGLGHLTPGRRLATLSGGEQARLALACVLSSGAELLLLDEPTNHLDQDAARRLQDRIARHRGTAVVVTHDRAFLESTATVVLEVDRDTRAVTRYGDGWAGYREARAAAHRRRVQDHQEWREELARTEELVAASGRRLATTGRDPGQGFGKHRRSHENKLSGQVRAARRRLEELRRDPVSPPPEPLTFRGRFAPTRGSGEPYEQGSGDPLAELRGVTVAGRLAVEELRIHAGDRLLVSGPNGAGKSTLLGLLAGELRPDTGTVRLSVPTGHLAQELRPEPAPDPRGAVTQRRVLDAYAEGRPGHPDTYADELLALGLLREEDLRLPVRVLSVGQRRRLELARIVSRPVGLLLLDEPTNHLAPGLVEELETALARFGGAVVAVSHDRRFRERFGGTALELRAGRPVAPAGSG
ncbi:ABC-F family ATP-binding cassette domain-containing protein [Streptomyces gulbargensis]|uniref:ABC-F family ATP-binding cassette domain-containing protein n=1 Tax=Streptomyces gulbargensis TaxID=364901 RepID=A0ABP7MF75_9ACTN